MATTPPLAESSPAAILPAPPSTTANDVVMCDDDAIMMQTDDGAVGPALPGAARPADDASSAASATRLVSDESTQGALDALAALAAASTAVSSIPSSAPPLPQQPFSSVLRPQEITPHHTSSEDDDSEIMPPPPPRGASCPSSAPPAAPSFAFLHDSTSYGNGAFSHHAGGGGRLRSASNPEGMEKWDFYSRRNDRQHFVLPFSILEEELASTRRVLGEVVDDGDCREYNTTDDVRANDGRGGNANDGRAVTVTHGFTSQPQQQQQPQQKRQQQERPKTTDAATGFQQHWVRRSKRTIAARFGTSPDSVSSDFLEGLEDVPVPPPSPPKSIARPKPTKSLVGGNSNGSSSAENNLSPSSKLRKKHVTRSTATAASSPPNIISSRSPPPEEDDVDESALAPDELLRRARSRLLEDLSEGNGGPGGDKGGNVLILPHSLSKYKEVYNKNGRIGIYTPAERAAIIQKFNAKRARRVWNKKIRYNCRKNLADRRMRVKGRFVKRSVESSAGSPPPPSECEQGAPPLAPLMQGRASSRSRSPPTTGSPLTTVNEHDEQPPPDADMPDVEDEEAGFEPSEDMPYRRARRYTIT